MGRSLEITTAIGCKNNCIYCPQDKLISQYSKRSKINRLSMADFKKFLNNVSSDVHLYFSGFSEPWINPDCTEMIIYAYEKGHSISVFTTTVGMKFSDIDFIKGIPFKNFVVHLPDNKGYTQIKVDNDYLAKMRKLLNVKISNLRFNCPILSTESNINQSLKILFSEYNIDSTELLMRPITRAGNIGLKRLPRPKKMIGVIRKCGDLDGGVLLPNGDVVLCCMDYGLKHILGNLSENSFDKLINSEEVLKIKKGFKDESANILCRYCEFAVKKRFSNNPLLEKYIFPLTTPLRKLLFIFFNKIKIKIVAWHKIHN